MELLEFIGEQYAVTLPQLARLIGRSDDTARSLRDRWKRAGWTNSAKLLVDAPPFIWLTSLGATNSPFRLWEPRHGLAAHIAAVTDVRIFCEDELRLGRWECERALARRLAREHRHEHLPDAVLTVDGRSIAIEVELTLKSNDRLEAIVEQLARSYDDTWYFAPAYLRRALERATAPSGWGNVQLRSYPPRADEFRGEPAWPPADHHSSW